MGKQYTIKDMHSLAKKKGGKCLSKEYVNNHTNLIWQCVEGHTWKAISSNVKKGTWCPYCAGKKKEKLEKGNKTEPI
jgi:hypothetical protein